MTAQEIYWKYRRRQHPQEKARWQALSMIAGGEIANTVAKKSGFSSGWITETVRRYNEGGGAAVKNKSKNNESRTLCREQAEELKKLIESGRTQARRLWTSSQVKLWVKEKTGSSIDKTTAWRMLVKLEFSRQVPRPGHEQKATVEEQAEFKKRLDKR